MTRLLFSLVLVLGSLASAGCAQRGPAPESNAIVEALAQKDVVILDVRSPEEFSGGHVEGALNLAVSQLNDRIETMVPDKDRQIVVHCASGVRSAKAKTLLDSMGYKKVLDAQSPQAVAKAMGKELVK
jgi:rhodanese-related sulfurtransferase